MNLDICPRIINSGPAHPLVAVLYAKSSTLKLLINYQIQSILTTSTSALSYPTLSVLVLRPCSTLLSCSRFFH